MRWKAWVPGTDGIELMQNVPELAELPVIFISGYGRDETIARALEAGAADYIVKPFSPTEPDGAGSGRRCAGAPTPSRSCWATWPSTTTGGWSPWPGARSSSPPPSTSCSAPSRSTPRTGHDLRDAAEPGLGRAGQRRHQGRARLRETAPPEARRRRGEPGLDLQRARRRLPHAPAGRPGRALTSTAPTSGNPDLRHPAAAGRDRALPLPLGVRRPAGGRGPVAVPGA